VIENKKKERKYGNQNTFLYKSPSRRWFRNRIHGLLRRADARGSVDIILPYVTHIAIVCGSGIVNDVTK